MASASNKLQIVISAQSRVAEDLKETRANLRRLKSEAADLHRRMESGEQGLQGELEQTRRELIRNETQLRELGREGSRLRREYKDMADSATTSSRRATRAFDGVSKKLGLTGSKVDRLRERMERLDDGADEFSSKWSRAFNKVDREADKTRRGMERSGKSGGFMAAGFGKVAGAAAAVTGAVMALGGAFTFLSDSVNEARSARQAMAQTAAVMRSMGRTESPKHIARMIGQLEEISGIDGDEIRQMTNTLFTFGNVSGDTFDRANALALDLSVRFGKDLQSSAVMVGKALNDPAKGLTALSRVGVSFTTQQQEQVKAMMAVGDIAGAQKIIMRELGKQVGGAAEAQADGIAKTQNAWKNLKEAIGEVLLSSSTGWDLTGKLQEATKWIKKNKTQIVSVLQKIISVVFKFASAWAKVLSIWIKGVGYVVGGVASILQAMAWLDPSMQGVADRAKGVADNFGTVSEALNNTSTYFDSLSTQADRASKRSKILADSLKQIRSREVRINVKTTLNDVYSTVQDAVDAANAPLPGRWTGGPVWPGERFMTGEIGPEIYLPAAPGGKPRVVGADGPEVASFGQSGWIVPNHLIATVTLPDGGRRPSAAPVQPVRQAPLVGQMVVQNERDAVRELERFYARQQRLAAEAY